MHQETLLAASLLRLKLQVAYDGRPFRGWQSQAGGDAIQDHLERAFFRLCGQKERIVVHGAGRTDAGVHALGQTAHVEVPETPWPLSKWVLALNAHLPPEIRVLKVSRAKRDFHARFSARGKVYTYRIWNAAVLPPLEIGRAWHDPVPVEVALLKQCAALLVGHHDFAGFAANRGKPDENTHRTIERIAVRKSGPLITLQFRGEGFLYKMVRLLTGSMMHVAHRREEPQWIERILKRELRSSFAAPAEGLCLSRVLY